MCNSKLLHESWDSNMDFILWDQQVSFTLTEYEGSNCKQTDFLVCFGLNAGSMSNKWHEIENRSRLTASWETSQLCLIIFPQKSAIYWHIGWYKNDLWLLSSSSFFLIVVPAHWTSPVSPTVLSGFSLAAPSPSDASWPAADTTGTKTIHYDHCYSFTVYHKQVVSFNY